MRLVLRLRRRRRRGGVGPRRRPRLAQARSRAAQRSRHPRPEHDPLRALAEAESRADELNLLEAEFTAVSRKSLKRKKRIRWSIATTVAAVIGGIAFFWFQQFLDTLREWPESSGTLMHGPRCRVRPSGAIAYSSRMRSTPVMRSVTGCSTWIRVFISMK